MRQNIYDNEIFSLEYNKMRKETRKGISANDLIEIPTIRKMISTLDGLDVLELGCGYGDNCKYFIDNGANYVLGTDISTKMINIATKENSDDNIEYTVLAIEDLNQLNKKFDLVVSSLAVHYVFDFDKLCKDVCNTLKDGGYFVFSQEHPIVTGSILNDYCEDDYVILGDKTYYLVSDYNRNGKRIVNWNKCDVVKYHRNFSEIINTLNKYFDIVELIEPLPTNEALSLKPKYCNQYDRPYFLFVKVKKK